MEKKLSNFLCIFCYKPVSAVNIKNLGDIRCPEKFVCLFLRYLEISSNVEGKRLAKEEVSFCDDCTKLCVLFCELFSQLESVRLQVDWKIRQIYETMDCAGRVKKRIQTENDAGSNSIIISHSIQKLRKNIMEQCKLKLMATQPKIFITRCVYNSGQAIQEEEPPSQKKNVLEGFDETSLHTNDNIDLIGMLMTFIAILHLSLPLHSSLIKYRSRGVIHEELNPITEPSKVDGIEVQLPCDAIVSQNHPEFGSNDVTKPEAQNPDALFAVNTSFENQEDISVAFQQHQAPLDSNQEEISVAFQQHQAPLDSNQEEISVAFQQHQAPLDSNQEEISVAFQQHQAPLDSNQEEISVAFQQHQVPLDSNQEEISVAFQQHQAPLDSNQEEISVALQQHQAPLDSNVSTQLMSQKCKICYDSFPHPLPLRNHMKLVHNLVVPLECQICGKELRDLYFLRGHMVSVHRTASGIPGTIKCSFCQERFEKVESLKTHISDFHQAYKCEQCLKTFETNVKLYQHKYKVHSKKYRSCGQCGKVFWTKKRLEDHLRIHSNIKLHNSSVPAHISSESNQQEIVIPDKNVANSLESLPQAPILQKKSTSMQQHVQTTQNLERMNESKVATCHLCHASFPLQKHLKCHLKTVHKETEWKYVCGVDGCEKRYRRSSHRNRHRITHLKIQFTCDFCGKSFSQRCNMRRHVVICHGTAVPIVEKPKSCVQTPNVDATATELPVQPVQIEVNNQTYSGTRATVQPEVLNGVESVTHYQYEYSNGLNPGPNVIFPVANPPSSAINQQYDYSTRMNAGMFNPASSNAYSTLQYYDRQGRNMPYSENWN